jgi:Tfp pilus assembly protein PilF
VWGLCAALALTVFLVFGQTLRHEFITYDDDEYFYANPHVQAGLTWSGACWAVRTTFASNWHPLTWLSLMLDQELFGSGPAGPHFTNVLLHAANSVLLFLLFRRLSGAFWRSALVAALFALHPLHVESVAWLAERKDMLSTFFGLLALTMYARYAQKVPGVRCQGSGARGQVSGAKGQVSGDRDQGSAKVRGVRMGQWTLDTGHWTLDYWLALLFFALGLMSKPMLVTLPFLMLLLDYWPLGRVLGFGFPVSNLDTQSPESGLVPGSNRQTGRAKLILEKLPFFALSAISAAVTLWAQREAVLPLVRISLGIRAVNAVVSCVRYLYKMFWPAHLAIPYPHPGYWPAGLLFFSVLLILAVSLGVIRLRRKLPFLLTGWLWYLGMLLPVIGLIQVGMQSMADRYTYLPLVGVFLMVAWGMDELLHRLRWGRPGTAMIAGAAVMILGVCATRTTQQLSYWRNSATLFGHAIAVTANNDIAFYNLGHYYASKGELDEAAGYYYQAIQIRPSYDDALNNLGVVLAQKGELDAAIPWIREAIRWRPDRADAYYNLGNAFALQHKLDEAAAAYTEALRLKPDYPEAHNNLGNVFALQGRRDLAVRHYRDALRLNPDHEKAKRALRALGAPVPE